MLFSGPLSLKRNRDLRQWIRLRVVIRMNLVCTAGFFIHVLMCTAYTNLADLQLDIWFVKINFVLFHFICLKTMTCANKEQTKSFQCAGVLVHVNRLKVFTQICIKPKQILMNQFVSSI